MKKEDETRGRPPASAVAIPVMLKELTYRRASRYLVSGMPSAFFAGRT